MTAEQVVRAGIVKQIFQFSYKNFAFHIKVYEKARSQNPNRWSRNIRNWNPAHLVWLNPEKKEETSEMNRLKKVA